MANWHSTFQLPFQNHFLRFSTASPTELLHALELLLSHSEEHLGRRSNKIIWLPCSAVFSGLEEFYNSIVTPASQRGKPRRGQSGDLAEARWLSWLPQQATGSPASRSHVSQVPHNTAQPAHSVLEFEIIFGNMLAGNVFLIFDNYIQNLW